MNNAPKYIRIEIESYRRTLNDYKLRFALEPSQELQEQIWLLEDSIANYEEALLDMGEPVYEF